MSNPLRSPVRRSAPLLLTLGLLSLTALRVAQAQTVDGTLDGSYGPALVLQTNTTGFGNAGGGSQTSAGGSEIDGAYAQISGGNLYLMLTGNLQNNGDKLEIFFDSKAGGQNAVSGGNNGSSGLGSMVGLTFDPLFGADYHLTVYCYNSGASFTTGGDFVVLGAGGAGGGLGQIQSRTRPLNFPGGSVGTYSIDNSNGAGVDGNGGGVGGAGAVTTGIELEIPLSTLGTSFNGGDIKICAFVNGGNHDFASNQVLGGLPLNTGNLGGDGNGNFTGNIGGVNFNNFGGTQFFTITNSVVVVTAPDIAVSPISTNYFNHTVGTSTVKQIAISNNGNAPLHVTNITSSTNQFTVGTTNLTVNAGATQNVNVTFSPTSAGVKNATLSVSSLELPTVDVSLTGTGVAVGQIVLDGTLDAGNLYGPVKALQTNGTTFGDNQNELNSAYATIRGNSLYVLLPGNLTGNKVMLFFDTDPYQGQQQLRGDNANVDFNALNAMEDLRFDGGFTADYFIGTGVFGSNAYLNYATLPTGGNGTGGYLSGNNPPFTHTLDFGGGVVGDFSYNNTNTGGVTGGSAAGAASATKGLEYRIPLSMLGSPGANTPIRIAAFIINGSNDFYSNQFLGGLPAGFGSLGNSDPDLSSFAGNQFFTVQRGDITISDFRTVGGDYRNVTVLNGGEANISGPTDVTGTFKVMNGGAATFEGPADAVVTGTGTFTLQAGGFMRIGSTGGITASGNTGQIRTTTRSFATDAVYEYGTAAGASMVTGSGLPATVRELIVGQGDGGPNTLTLSQDVAVRQRVALGGNLLLDGRQLRLLSGPGGTAFIDNFSGEGGMVTGPTGAMECALGTAVPGLVYRHYSSPMSSGATIGDLAVAGSGGFTPVVNNAYNTTPFATRFDLGVVSPFPNVFGYNEALVATDFAEGWVSPTSLANAMADGRGYAVAMVGRPKVTITGQFQNDPVTVPLTNTANNGESGWNFLGNPFPAAIDWADADIQPGMSSQVSVWRPASGANAQGGSYLTFVNGQGGTFNGIIPAMEGLFVRRTSTAGSLDFTFEHALRQNEFDPSAIHLRQAPAQADLRPVANLVLRGTGTLASSADEATIYFQTGATAGLDDRYDGLKVGFSTGTVPTLATRLPGGELAQIDGRPVVGHETVVPLLVQVAQTGTYVLDLTAARNFAAGQRIFLADAVTGTTQELTQQPTYQFTMDQAYRGTRFTLRFEAAGTVTGTAGALADTRLSVFPNPAASGTALRVEWAGTQPLTGTLTLTDALGRVVREQALTGVAATTVAGLTKGVYVLRVTTEAGPQVRRVVIE